MFKNMYFVLSFVLVGITNACLFDECDRPDFGSCGNACCRLNIYVQGENTVSVMNKLKGSISSGGPDNLYSPMLTSDNLLFKDMRSQGTDEHFLGQAIHTTEDKQYNDTVNLLISSRDNGRSTNIMAFSISQMGGTFSDSGQNYYNLFQLFDKLDLTSGYKLRNADSSCSGARPEDLPEDM
jgi:hypothetical protein